MLTMLAQTREVQSLDGKGCNRLFAEIQRRYPFFSLVMALTPEGNAFAATVPFQSVTSFADRKYFTEAVRTRDFSAGEFINGRISKTVLLHYAYPVLDPNQRLIAVVVAAFSLNEYQHFVSKVNLPEGYATLITDWKGVRLFRSPENPKTPIGVPVSPQFLKFVTGDQELGFREFTASDDVNRIYAFQQMRLNAHSPPYMYMFVGLPKDAILHAANAHMLENTARAALCRSVDSSCPGGRGYQMIALENPPGFVLRTEAQKAAFDNGFRLERGIESGWLRYDSTTARGEVWIAGAGTAGPWLLSLGHPGVAAEIGPAACCENIGPGAATFVFDTLHQLYLALDRAYRLGVCLPDGPLRRFCAATQGMPRSTEAERIAVQRIGQAFFRQALLEYWGSRCPLTGITDPELLRASHVVPWAECETDALRLDVHNGLLLSALWDAAFDAGLVSFADDGAVLMSPKLTLTAVAALNVHKIGLLAGLTVAHGSNLVRHRSKHGF